MYFINYFSSTCVVHAKYKHILNSILFLMMKLVLGTDAASGLSTCTPWGGRSTPSLSKLCISLLHVHRLVLHLFLSCIYHVLSLYFACTNYVLRLYLACSLVSNIMIVIIIIQSIACLHALSMQQDLIRIYIPSIIIPPYQGMIVWPSGCWPSG